MSFAWVAILSAFPLNGKCPCGTPWVKCQKHFMHEAPKQKKVSASRKRGTEAVRVLSDKPPPKKRLVENGVVLGVQQFHTQVRLRPGTALAARFPHLVVRSGEG